VLAVPGSCTDSDKEEGESSRPKRSGDREGKSGTCRCDLGPRKEEGFFCTPMSLFVSEGRKSGPHMLK
jgi:hypothetical protein